MDVLAGEPVAEDFFCLQASPKALPLASEIPYELTAGSREQLRTLESIFLAASADSRPSRFDQVPSPAKPKSGNNKTPRQSRWKMWSGIGGGVVLLIVVAFVMFSGKQPTQRSKTPPNSHTPATPVQSDQKTSTNKVQFDAFLTRGKKAMDDKNFEEAARQFEQALRIFPDDATAKDDLLQTQESLKKASVDVEFSNALRAAQKAFDAQQFDEALTNLAKAQALNPNDPQAMELATRVKQRQQAAQVERTYADAVKAAQQALTISNFNEAIHQGKLALIAKPDDSVATSLLQKGEASKAESEKWEAAYNTAMTAARQALNAKKYDDAIEQAQAALKIKPPDLNAKQIIQVAQQRKSEIAAQVQIQVAYEKALAAAQKALNNSNYDEAARVAQAALKSKPDDDEASQLLALAKGKMAASVSATATVETNPMVLLSPGSDAFTNAIGMVFIRVANVGPGVAYVGKYEVTQNQFREVMGRLPENQPVIQDDLPVENVSFEEATNFCDRLSKRGGKSYALPTKAEWLAMANMANLTPQEVPSAWAFFTNHFASVEVTSWNRETPLTAPARGGSLGAQTNGFCDLFGNVREWIAGKESAGFSYDTQGFGRRKDLFSGDPYLKIVTGLRCLIRAGNPTD
jgi:formylglycine-generating enzyme required for sulfatase activity